jgi:predicted CXXCH cytochrome family protein
MKRSALHHLVFAAVILLAGAGTLVATDPPHDPANPNFAAACSQCHITHRAPGLGLTTQAGNANLCKSCHATATTRAFKDWQSSDQALPGTSGTSHRWDASSTSAAAGATTPTAPAMALRLESGKLMCSTCHDQHSAANPGGSTHASTVTKVQNGGGTGTVVVNSPTTAASARNYLIAFIATTSFRVSNDDGTSWFGWNSGTSAWEAGYPSGRSVGTNLTLNDGANVTVSFAGTFAIGDRYKFFVSRPFLRVSNVASAMCENCHAGRVQSAAYVESGGDGVKVFSHPVGETLSKPYDRAANAIRDANGAAQATAGDGLATNDLALDAGGTVRCMSCHFPHGADSNSLTEDPR